MLTREEFWSIAWIPFVAVVGAILVVLLIRLIRGGKDDGMPRDPRMARPSKRRR
jgi:hypothetical protein